MLSPVSPSATGKTFRSLTSWRRASSAARPASTSARKRRMAGSLTQLILRRQAAPTRRPVAGLTGLCDLPGLKAARADVHTTRRTAVVDPHPLKVGIEAAICGNHRVAAAVAEG